MPASIPTRILWYGSDATQLGRPPKWIQSLVQKSSPSELDVDEPADPVSNSTNGGRHYGCEPEVPGEDSSTTDGADRNSVSPDDAPLTALAIVKIELMEYRLKTECHLT